MARRVRMTWNEAKQWVKDNPHLHHHVVEFTSCVNKEVYTQENPLITSYGVHNKHNTLSAGHPGWGNHYVVWDEVIGISLTTESDTLVLEIPGRKARKRKQ